MHARIKIIIAWGMLAMLSVVAAAQDMMQHVDLTSPEMTSAEMSRADVEAAIAAATSAHPIDFTGKKLSGLDLSGLDLSGAVLRAAKLNKTSLPVQSSTGRFWIRPGFWRPISAEQISKAPACLPRRCSARDLMEPTFRERASRLT